MSTQNVQTDAKTKTQDVDTNIYTHPKLHGNLVLGSLQLLFWLFFRPSAWENHLKGIDQNLSPHFSFAQLSLAQWRQPALWRLFVMILIIWPLGLALSVGLTLWVLHVGLGLWPNGFAEGALTSIALVVSCSIIMSVLMGTMLALETAPIGGVLFSFGASIGTMFVEIRLGTIGGFTGFILPFPEPHELREIPLLGTTFRFSLMFLVLGLVISLAVGLFGSFVSRLADQKDEQKEEEKNKKKGLAYLFSLLSGKEGVRKQILAVLIGFMVGAVGVVIGLELLWGGEAQANVSPLTLGIVVGFGTVFGSITGWRTGHWRRGIGLFMGVSGLFGGVFLLAVSRPSSLTTGISFGIFLGALASFLFILPYIFVERYVGPRVAAVITAVVTGSAGATPYMEFIDPWIIVLPFSLIATLSGLTWPRWLPVLLYPFEMLWNRSLYWRDQQHEQSHSFHWHSTFWDEHQRLPLKGLDDHLVLLMERDPAEGKAVIELLSTTKQRWAPQAAQIELDARHLEGCTDVKTISHISRYLAAEELEGPASRLLRDFRRISKDVQQAQNQEDNQNQCQSLIEAKNRLDELLTSRSEQYYVRFRPIADSWCQIVADEIKRLADAAEQNHEIQNPYILNVLRNTSQETTFVERTDISARIEQLLLDPRCPPLLLYGQGGMGKTSLLLNLSRLLPSTIVLFFVDGQLISGAKSCPDFLYNMAKQMINDAEKERGLILPSLNHKSLREHPETYFNDWLDEVKQSLQRQQVALLTLDEFGALENMPKQEAKKATGFLRMLHHRTSHRPRFKVLLAGSRTLKEYQHAESHLTNTQVIKISYLNEKETRQLVEQPVKHFSLRYEPDASQRVYDLTRGYPYLVQLLCNEIVELKNKQAPAKRRLACLANVEAAAKNALDSGNFFFADIKQNQVDKKGVALLCYLAKQGEGAIVKRDILAKRFPDKLDSTLKLLLLRDLIEPVDDGYRFQVELIRRWFAKGGPS